MKRRTVKSLNPAEARTWRAMLSRCYYPKHHSYPRYHARGITVCDEWRNDFAQFLADMGKKPSPDLTLERIDNDKGYSPGNCKWATYVEQNNNRSVKRKPKPPLKERGTRFLTWGGVTQSLSQWAKHHGLSRACLHRRLMKGETLPYAFRPVRQ